MFDADPTQRRSAHLISLVILLVTIGFIILVLITDDQALTGEFAAPWPHP